MLPALMLALLVTPAPSPSPSGTAGPTPAPTAKPTPSRWMAATSQDPTEYGRFKRSESGGTTSILIATARTCDCKSADVLANLSSALGSVPGAVATRSPVKACGTTADRLLVTGIASRDGRTNLEVVSFSSSSSLHTIEYLFSTAAPLADVESSMLVLCAKGDAP